MWNILKEAASNWSAHKDARQGAALAYYSVFSIGPVIVIAIAIAGVLFGRDAVTGQVAASIKGMIGETGAQAVQAMLSEAGRPREGLLASALGTAAVVLAAVGVVVQLKDALNIVWEVDETKETGVRHFVLNYVASFAAVLALGFLLMVSLVVTTAVSAFGNYAGSHLQEWLLHLLTLVVSFAVISLLFAMMFKWLPDASVDWYDVWVGAAVTAALFEIGKFAIGYYIGRQGLESTYGAAASIIVVLIWVYYSSQIILFGAEITHAFAAHQGSINARRAG
ncbi:MAG: YihY/virulence factor BrkB family protein [Bradyrhizobium sp.]|uniref:YihY/virulence factor BrkB family protein n=1 Tax=Bradyrhizobium sp. TaxID=376 RepID=UPI001DE519CA|nr:YihY/virulence factor BrkB family protein [Bradyrhizobium sp.]MBV9560100.1 YihY/virulence factor BrkB family protein [Bradyrhizobium sp.]